MTMPRLWAFLAVALPMLAALVANLPSVDLAYHLRAGGQMLDGGGIPAEAGAPPDPALLRRAVLGAVPVEWVVYGAAILSVPVFALLVTANRATLIPEDLIARLQEGSGLREVASVFLAEIAKPAGMILMASGVVAIVYLGYATLRLEKVPRERMYVGTNRAYEKILRAQAPGVPESNFILEPCRRDVAAAVALAFFSMEKDGVSGPFMFQWADNYVRNTDALERAIACGRALVEDDPERMVFIGEKPRYPSENLGWIELGQKLGAFIEIGGLEVVEITHAYAPTLLGPILVLVHDAVDDRDELFRVEGLDDPAGAAGGLALVTLVLAGFGREDQDGQGIVLAGGAHILDELDAVHDRHVDVGDDHVDILRPEHVQPLLAILGLQHLEPGIAQRMVEHGQDGARIIDSQYAQRHFIILENWAVRPSRSIAAFMAALGASIVKSNWCLRAVSAALTNRRSALVDTLSTAPAWTATGPSSSASIKASRIPSMASRSITSGKATVCLDCLAMFLWVPPESSPESIFSPNGLRIANYDPSA